jgi:outer membrane protein OmpA-like peptidoglycan-associated protein
MKRLVKLSLAMTVAAAQAHAVEPPGSELWFFGGLQGGLSNLSGTNAVEAAKGGYNLGIKGLASKYTPNWVFDAGLGWFHDNQSASQGASSVKVKTNAGFTDLGARRRLGDGGWQLGPVVQILFGPDVNLSEATAPGTETHLAALGGVKISKDFLMSSTIARIGAQVVTDLTIANRQVTWFQIDFQLGLPTRSREAPAPAPAPEPTPEPVVELPVPPMVAKEEVIFPARVTHKQEVEITLNDVFFHFDTASAKLHPPSVRKLKKLALYLLKNNDAWKSMRVDGHTDRRGTLAYNTRLSKRRARAVAQQLTRGGLDDEKMKVQGFGPTRPVDPARNHVAYQKNRRVEVILEGVTDPAKLAREINQLAE